MLAGDGVGGYCFTTDDTWQIRVVKSMFVPVNPSSIVVAV